MNQAMHSNPMKPYRRPPQISWHFNWWIEWLFILWRLQMTDDPPLLHLISRNTTSIQWFSAFQSGMPEAVSFVERKRPTLQQSEREVVYKLNVEHWRKNPQSEPCTRGRCGIQGYREDGTKRIQSIYGEDEKPNKVFTKRSQSHQEKGRRWNIVTKIEETSFLVCHRNFWKEILNSLHPNLCGFHCGLLVHCQSSELPARRITSY